MLNLPPNADRVAHLIQTHAMRVLDPAKTVPIRVEVDGQPVEEPQFIRICGEWGVDCGEVARRLYAARDAQPMPPAMTDEQFYAIAHAHYLPLETAAEAGRLARDATERSRAWRASDEGRRFMGIYDRDEVERSILRSLQYPRPC